jgi:Mn2+/Fe2+ NRAMP family transporter
MAFSPLALAMGFLPINPIQLLVWTAVINGVVAVPIMAMMMLIVTNRSAMDRFQARLHRLLGRAGPLPVAAEPPCCRKHSKFVTSDLGASTSALGQKQTSD